MYPIPHYKPVFKNDTDIPKDEKTQTKQVCLKNNLPLLVYRSSSLYHPPFGHNNSIYSPVFNRLTLFGQKGSIATFSFQKMCTRSLPVAVRKECCGDHHSHGEEHKNGQPCAKKDTNLGGFVTILSSEHSHNHK
jgi:hypothetical protein